MAQNTLWENSQSGKPVTRPRSKCRRHQTQSSVLIIFS